jgi:hypothetical protein
MRMRGTQFSDATLFAAQPANAKLNATIRTAAARASLTMNLRYCGMLTFAQDVP